MENETIQININNAMKEIELLKLKNRELEKECSKFDSESTDALLIGDKIMSNIDKIISLQNFIRDQKSLINQPQR